MLVLSDSLCGFKMPVVDFCFVITIEIRLGLQCEAQHKIKMTRIIKCAEISMLLCC